MKANKIFSAGNRILGIITYAAAIFMFFTLYGCGESRVVSDNAINVYYLNKDGMKVVDIPYEPLGSNTEELVNECIVELKRVDNSAGYIAPISENIAIVSVGINDGLLIIDYDRAYYQMDRREEILRRAAIVRTMTQIQGIDGVQFTVEGSAITDSKSQPIGIMTADMFIDNAGDEINSYEKTKLVLYFANENGDSLIKTTEAVAYNSNISMEKLVTEHIIMGPFAKDVYATVSPNTQILSVTTKDGVCYVNLSHEFLVKQGNQTDEVVLYSFVNSLTELPNINKVQFMIDSETEISFGEHSYLNAPYERSLELVVAD